jgi:hypothetical protein
LKLLEREFFEIWILRKLTNVASILGISNGDVISGYAKIFEDYFFKCIHMVLAFVVEQSAFRIRGVVDKSKL